jgi:HAD superfamily hydrolase (TIGR01549 family)
MGIIDRKPGGARVRVDSRVLSLYIARDVDAQGRPTLDQDRIDAVLFDLDGTLMDSDDQVVETLAVGMQRLGWRFPHRSARSLVMAAETPLNGLMTLLDAVGLDAPLMWAWKRSRGLRSSSTDVHHRLMEGADSMLAELGQRYRLAVVTTRGRRDAQAFLTQHALDSLFEVLVTRGSTRRLKPHPEPIYRAAKELGVPVDRCVMVGDTTMDVKSARRAGAKAIAVLCGFGERGELERAGADLVLDHVSALSAVL